MWPQASRDGRFDRPHSPARPHATAGAQRPPSSLRAGGPVKLAKAFYKPLRKTLSTWQARAPPTPSIRPPHTPLSPRPSPPTEPQERHNSLLAPLSTLTRDLGKAWGKAWGGREGSGATTNMAATAATLTNAEAVAATAVKRAVGIPRCGCQEVSHGRSASTAALRLLRAR